MMDDFSDLIVSSPAERIVNEIRNLTEEQIILSKMIFKDAHLQPDIKKQMEIIESILDMGIKIEVEDRPVFSVTEKKSETKFKPWDTRKLKTISMRTYSIGDEGVVINLNNVKTVFIGSWYKIKFKGIDLEEVENAEEIKDSDSTVCCEMIRFATSSKLLYRVDDRMKSYERNGI